MRPTLRSLLAQRDHLTLTSSNDSEPGRSPEAGADANALLNRIQNLATQPRMACPTLPTTGTLDPNHVARYIDNTLPAELCPKFERACVKSDPALAELAAVHQIVFRMSEQSASIPARLRDRVYQIPLDLQNGSSKSSRPTPETETETESTPTTDSVESVRGLGRQSIASAANVLANLKTGNTAATTAPRNAQTSGTESANPPSRWWMLAGIFLLWVSVWFAFPIFQGSAWYQRIAQVLRPDTARDESVDLADVPTITSEEAVGDADVATIEESVELVRNPLADHVPATGLESHERSQPESRTSQLALPPSLPSAASSQTPSPTIPDLPDSLATPSLQNSESSSRLASSSIPELPALLEDTQAATAAHQPQAPALPALPDSSTPDSIASSSHQSPTTDSAPQVESPAFHEPLGPPKAAFPVAQATVNQTGVPSADLADLANQLANMDLPATLTPGKVDPGNPPHGVGESNQAKNPDKPVTDPDSPGVSRSREMAEAGPSEGSDTSSASHDSEPEAVRDLPPIDGERETAIADNSSQEEPDAVSPLKPSPLLPSPVSNDSSNASSDESRSLAGNTLNASDSNPETSDTSAQNSLSPLLPNSIAASTEDDSAQAHTPLLPSHQPPGEMQGDTSPAPQTARLADDQVLQLRQSVAMVAIDDRWSLVLPGGIGKLVARGQTCKWDLAFSGVSRLAATVEHGEPQLEVQRCFVLLQCDRENETFRIRTPKGDLFLTALQPESELVVEVRPYLPPGFTADATQTRYVLGCLGVKGTYVVEHNQKEKAVSKDDWLMIDIDGQVTLENRSLPEDILASIAYLKTGQPMNTVAKLNQLLPSPESMEQLLEVSESGDRLAGNVTESSELRSLAAIWCYYIGCMDPIVPILNDPTMSRQWNDHLLAVRDCLLSDSAARSQLLDSLARYQQPANLAKRITLYNPQEIQANVMEELVGDLQNGLLLRRVLAIHALQQLWQKDYGYDPVNPAANQAAAIQQWQNLLQESRNSRVGVAPARSLVPSR